MDSMTENNNNQSTADADCSNVAGFKDLSRSTPVVEYKYANSTNIPLFLINEFGVVNRLNPSIDPNNINAFIITETRSYNYHSAIAQNDNYKREEILPKKELIAREAFYKAYKNKSLNPNNGFRITITHKYEIDSFIKLGYMRCGLGGLTIATSDISKSNVFTNYSTNEKYSLDNFGATISVVDNTKGLGDLFINVFGEIKTITPETSYNRSNGIYVSYFRYGDEYIETRYGLDELRKVGLYSKYSEALEAQSILPETLEALKTNIKNQQSKIDSLSENLNEVIADRNQLKIKLENIKLEYERKDILLEGDVRTESHTQKLEEIEVKRKALKSERKLKKAKYKTDVRGMRNKEEFDHRDYRRKETIETIKTVGLVVAGGLILYKAAKEVSDYFNN